MKVAIINYGIGNLGSVQRCMEEIDAHAYIATHPSMLYDANRIILPGVGAFSEGMTRLEDGGWTECLRDLVSNHQKPIMGICLGMQLLASSGEEGGQFSGLGFIPGSVVRLDAVGCNLKIPHVGWNSVQKVQEDFLLKEIPDESDFYFVHSYGMVVKDRQHLLATVSYGCNIAAIVRNKNIFGCQFHPEKSSKAGRKLLKNFMEFTPC
jgi:glutamine amidotransferase